MLIVGQQTSVRHVATVPSWKQGYVMRMSWTYTLYMCLCYVVGKLIFHYLLLVCACRYVQGKPVWDSQSMVEDNGIYDTIASMPGEDERYAKISMPGEDERYLSIRSARVIKNPKFDDDEERYATMSLTSEKPIPSEEDECYIMFDQSPCQQGMDSKEKVDVNMKT